MEAEKGRAVTPKGVPKPSNKRLSPADPTALIEPLPGSADAIGHSFDTFGYYANPRSIMRELFHFAPQEEIIVEGRSWLLSSDFVYTAIRDTETYTLSNRTKDFYSSELAASVKLTASYNAFSSSVQSDFSHSFTDETDTTYTSVRTNVNKWRLSLRDGVEALRSKLLPAFKEALANMAPKDLFDAYGTHYLYMILVGGRADYVASTKTSAFESSTKIGAVAQASFADIVGLEVSAEYKELVKKFRENSSTSLYALGGSSLSNITDPATYEAWLKSIDTLPVFCGFTYDSLKPIWELADSSQRQQLLKNATETYIPLRVTQEAIVDLQVIISDNYSESPPFGFTKINYDLNRNAGGDYVFLCYKQQKISVAGAVVDPAPITDIIVVYGSNSNLSAPYGYTKINKDLNSGSGGKFIYFCYTRDKSKQEDGLPIRGLRVVGPDKNSVAPYGFNKIDIDLNMDAGGDYIYLCTSRHLP